MIRCVRRIGATIASSGQKANSGFAFPRLRLALTVILCLSVAFWYWSDHKYHEMVYRDGIETVSVVGITLSVDSFFDAADNLAGALFLLMCFGVIILSVLPRTTSALLPALTLIVVGAILLAAILRVVIVGTESPGWLGNTIIWGLPIAVGITLFQELFLYFCPLVARRKLL